MGPTASARKLSVASAIAAAEAELKERPSSSRYPAPTPSQIGQQESALEEILSECRHGPPEGYQDEIRAYLEAQVEAGATLVDCREDGTLVELTKSGERVISHSRSEDN